MYSLIAKLVEIVVDRVGSFLERRKSHQDVAIATGLAELLLLLQDICIRGGRIVTLARKLLAGSTSVDDEREYEQSLVRQSADLDEVRVLLDRSREILGTMDIAFGIELVPLLDEKSGLVTKWQQQVAQAKYSETTISFISSPQMEDVIEIGKRLSRDGVLTYDRTPYLVALSDALRVVRSDEIRDLRRVGDNEKRQRLEGELTTAAAQLDHAKVLCSSLLDGMTKAFGSDVMAELRRNAGAKTE